MIQNINNIKYYIDKKSNTFLVKTKKKSKKDI